MAVEAIQLNKHDSNQAHASYLKAGALGALTGYSLKYILPVSKVEKELKNDEFFVELKKTVKEARLKEIEAIRNSKTKTEATDVFISMVDKKEIKASKLKELKEPIAIEVKKLIIRVNDKARAVKAVGNEIFTAMTKHIRPTKTFVAAGVGVACAGALVYNLLARTKVSEEEE